MNKLIGIIGSFVIVGLIAVGCSSVTDSGISELETKGQTITLESGENQANSNAGNAKNGLGKIEVGVDASVWDSNVQTDPVSGIFPIGGSGQVNGEFTIGTVQGVEIGLRAQQRFEGTIEANGNRVGGYESLTSPGGPGDAGVWNYDWHIDLRDGKNAHKDRTLGDYSVTLETNITDGEDLFGFPLPLDLTFGEQILENAVLYQSSQNPGFGNDIYNPSVQNVYTFKLVLTPKTFNGPPLAVSIEVDVKD